MSDISQGEIRLLIVDDHGLFRESLGRLLEAEPGFRIAGHCATTAEALQLLQSVPVDLVLLDYDLGTEQGSALLEQWRGLGLSARILMVTAGMADAEIGRAMDAGIAGIFLKHSPPGKLIEAIRAVMRGDSWLAPRAKEVSNKAAPRVLTERERTVLSGIFEGLTNKEIAGNLAVSESSVKSVIQQLFEKTGVRTRSQLVRIALEQHLR